MFKNLQKACEQKKKYQKSIDLEPQQESSILNESLEHSS